MRVKRGEEEETPSFLTSGLAGFSFLSFVNL